MLNDLSLYQLSEALKKKQFSSKELTKYYLNRINQFKDINAYISVNEELALQQAEIADQIIAKDEAQILTGIPFAHKDIFCTKNVPTTCGSKMLENFIAPYDATLVKNLAKSHPVMLGKTNMDEFAMGTTNETSFFGSVKNPWQYDYVPGGSSGGSAAAVSGDLAVFATGSDTGGSIRQPSAFCGLTGLKPTYGLISRYGMIAYASSLDQAGPMAKSIEDLAIVLKEMAGFDPNDSTSINTEIPDYFKALKEPTQPLTIGVPKEFFTDDVDENIKIKVREALSVFEKNGSKIVEVDLSLMPLWVPCYCVIAYAEASSNLARYDGVRYGYRTQDSNNFTDLVIKSRNEAFGMEVKRRILTGTYVLSSGYYDDYYLRAQKIRRMILNELLNILNEVDVIIGPTTPMLPYKLGEKAMSSAKRSLGDTFTVAANLAGLPALSIPVGFANGLPIGMQIIGNQLSEARLLNIAHFYQQNTNWHKEKPQME